MGINYRNMEAVGVVGGGGNRPDNTKQALTK